MSSPNPPFEVIWEIEPPASSGIDQLHRQLDSARDAATSVLVPDNHTGRATVSSITVARIVTEMGMPAIACLNARDRNLLGLRRDLLTCTFEGVRELLLVYGDEPEVGSRSGDLTVRTMLEECRNHDPDLRVGVTSRLGALPAWKQSADRLFVQVSYDIDALLRWRDQITFGGQIIPAVMVIPSTAMARRLAARIPELAVPDRWLDAIDRDPGAGLELAATLAEAIQASGAFDGVHIVSGRQHRRTANRCRGLGVPAHPLILASV